MTDQFPQEHEVDSDDTGDNNLWPVWIGLFSVGIIAGFACVLL